MKTVIKPGVPEIVRYECDVTGLQLKNGPAVTVTIKCGYGSVYDGGIFDLDLSDQAAAVVLPLLRSLLLDGAPFGPHRSGKCLNEMPCVEKHITWREGGGLLRKLKKLNRYKKRSLSRVKAGLADSAVGRIVSRGAFPKPAAQTFPVSANKSGNRRQRMKIVRAGSGRETGASDGEAVAERSVIAGTKRRRKRVLLPEFEKMMRGPKSNDVQATLDDVRGDR
jgi:hypothetical protein